LCFELWREVIVVFAFDTLGYSKRLREAEVPANQADAHAEAARDFIMTELAIRSDLLSLQSDVAALRNTVALKSDLAAMRNELLAAIEKSTLQTTVRLGGMVIAGVGVMAGCVGVLAFLLRSH
jgi:hypothetical protein